jgi:hypothetical protein
MEMVEGDSTIEHALGAVEVMEAELVVCHMVGN